jgi:hypothetical protein
VTEISDKSSSPAGVRVVLQGHSMTKGKGKGKEKVMDPVDIDQELWDAAGTDDQEDMGTGSNTD